MKGIAVIASYILHINIINIHFYISVHLITGGAATSATSTCHEVACVR